VYFLSVSAVRSTQAPHVSIAATWLWYLLRENQVVYLILVHHVNQIRNASYNDRKINDLNRLFRYLISRQLENSCIVCTHSRSRYTRYIYGIHVDDIYPTRVIVAVPAHNLMKIPAVPMLWFCKIYPIGAFDLTCNRIDGTNNQRELTLHLSCPSHRKNVKLHASDSALYHAICTIRTILRRNAIFLVTIIKFVIY